MLAALTLSRTLCLSASLPRSPSSFSCPAVCLSVHLNCSLELSVETPSFQASISRPLSFPRVFCPGHPLHPSSFVSALSIPCRLFPLFSGLLMPPSLFVSLSQYLCLSLPFAISQSLSLGICLFSGRVLGDGSPFCWEALAGASELLRFSPLVNAPTPAPAPRGAGAPVDSSASPQSFPGLPGAQRAVGTQVGEGRPAPRRHLLQLWGCALHGPRRLPLLPRPPRGHLPVRV